MAILISQNINIIQNVSASSNKLTQEYGGTLIDASLEEAETLNPVLSSDSNSTKINDILFEGMVNYDKDMNIIPFLAYNWEISEDKLDYIFHLREDVKWHDGEQFNAEDVIFTLDRIITEENKNWSYFDHFILFGIIFDSNHRVYEMIDDFTVEFHLQTPYVSFLKKLAFLIIPEHVYLNHAGVDGIRHTTDDCRDVNGTYTFDNDPANEYPVGTGCMMFSEWNKNNNITLIRNSIANGGSGYWLEHDAYLDSYIVRKIDDINVQVLLLRKGSIDMMCMDNFYEEVEILSVNPNITVYFSPIFSSDHIAFQCDPFKGNLYGQESRDFENRPNYLAGFEWQTIDFPEHTEIKGHLVRQALNYAIDKEGLIDHAYPQGFRNLGPIYSAQTEWYNEDINPYNYNLTKANGLLEQAGFGVDATDPLRSELNFTISYLDGNLRYEKICDFVQYQWTDLGISVDMEAILFNGTNQNNRDFDVKVSSWTGGGDDPEIANIWSSSNIIIGGNPIFIADNGSWIWEGEQYSMGSNYASYWNPRVDQFLYYDYVEEYQNLQKTYYDQMQEIIVKDSPYIWILSHVTMLGANKNIEGFMKGSFAGFWPEPIGFRNIHFKNLDSTNTDTTGGNGLFEFLNNIEINNITIIDKITLFDIALVFLIAVEVVILFKVVQKTILNKELKKK